MLKKTEGTANTNTQITNYLSEAVTINGTFTSSKDAIIAGKVEGDVHVHGLLKIEKDGEIIGNLNANNMDISGKIHGEVRCEGKLTIRKSAVITADLFVNSLQVEADAFINGEIHISKSKETPFVKKK